MTTRPLIVVGAGVAGLALGLALKRAGFEALVLERRPELPLEGAGVQIGPNGTRMLRLLGVFDAIAAHASEPVCIQVHDGSTGRALTRLPLGTWMTARHGSPYWVVHRHDLVLQLFHAAKQAGVAIRFGVDVSGVRNMGDGAHVELADGSLISAAGVVGADGVWSQVRRNAFADVDPMPSGRLAARALISGPAAGDFHRDAVSVWMVKDAHLVTYPVQHGASLNVVLVSHGSQSDQRWSTPISSTDVLARLSAFHKPLWALHEMTDAWRQWPLVTLPPLKSYAKGHVALVGDAAHPMQPFLAQGAVMALEDAVVIAHFLTTLKSDVAAAFSAYAAARHMRTQRVVAAAERNGKVYHLSGAMAAARNAALTATPAPLFMRGYDWLYGERVDAGV